MFVRKHECYKKKEHLVKKRYFFSSEVFLRFLDCYYYTYSEITKDISIKLYYARDRGLIFCNYVSRIT